MSFASIGQQEFLTIPFLINYTFAISAFENLETEPKTCYKSNQCQVHNDHHTKPTAVFSNPLIDENGSSLRQKVLTSGHERKDTQILCRNLRIYPRKLQSVRSHPIKCFFE